MTNNRTIVDLSKVQHATFFYINQYGQRCYVLPLMSTFRMEFISTTQLAMWHPDYPTESEYERAARLQVLDVWTPTVYFQLSANHNLVYTGKKALELYSAFKGRIFNKTKKTKKK